MFSVVVSAVITMTTTFDLWRNQYLFLGVDLLEAVPRSMMFLIGRMACLHIAPDEQEATIYGIVTSVHAISYPLGRGLGNVLYGLLPALTSGDWENRGALTEPENFIADTPEQRMSVAVAYCLMYVLTLVSIFFLQWCPNTRREAEATCTAGEAEYRLSVGCITVGLLLAGFVGGLVLGVGAMLPDAACLAAFGGAGC